MASAAAFDDDDGAPRKTWLWLVIGVVALALAGLGVWWVNGLTVGKDRKAPPTTTALLLPPPPPPPPPPPQEKPPEPVETTKPVPVETPTPTPAKAADAPAAVAIDAAATGAGDDFGLKGGGPGGMGGAGATGTGTGAAGGISDSFYGQNLRNALQQRIQDADGINRQVFSADFAVWVDGGGRVTKAELLRSSGDAKRDQKLLALLQATNDLDAPPASIRFPARITVRGKKSSL